MNRTLNILCVCAALCMLVLCSCEHKDLCYDHPHGVQARIDVDWSLFTQEQPTGMTVMLYSLSGGRDYTMLSNNTAYVDATVLPDTYRAVAYNQSTTEFGTLTFDNMDSMADATVRAATKTSRWYKTRADGERVVENPEWFAVGATDNVVVPDASATRHGRMGTRSTIATIVPQCVVYTIHVTVHIKNAYNLRSARASIDGLADGYSLGPMAPTTTVATQLLEEWTLTRDADNPANGTLRATITSFGLPSGHAPVAQANHLCLSLLLVDNKTQCNYDFAVGDAFVVNNRELSLSLHRDINQPLPDVKPEGGASGGFDATVDDWGDETNIDIGV